VDADQEQAVRLAVQLLDTGDANTVDIEVLFDVWVRLEPLWLSSTPLPTVLDVINLREPNPIDIADCADLYGRIGEAIVARGSIGLLRKPILAQSARALDFQEFANQSDPDSLIAFGMLAPPGRITLYGYGPGSEIDTGDSSRRGCRSRHGGPRGHQVGLTRWQPYRRSPARKAGTR
jgi:hypothetical protein